MGRAGRDDDRPYVRQLPRVPALGVSMMGSEPPRGLGRIDLSRWKAFLGLSDPWHLRVLWSIVLGWCAIVVITALSHEFWRDEVRALSIAIDARSLAGLPALLQDEGHPVLWYAMLWAAYHST